jgi:CBS domain-containing protein
VTHVTWSCNEQQVELLAKLRDARYLVLRDAEAFHEAATTLEYVGQVSCGQIRNGLGYYKKEIVDLAVKTKRHDAPEVGKLFEVVREARNKAVHVGSFARHLNSRLIELILILEEAIMSGMREVQDLMVRNPVVAEAWQLVAHVRNTMLANSFSTLPIRANGGWMIVTDTAVMRLIQLADRDVKLGMTVLQAVDGGMVKLAPAICVRPNSPISEVVGKMNHLPILVTDATDESRLMGIITPFDLL